MTVRIEQTEGFVTAHLLGEIDHHTAADMREKIDRAVESASPDELELDFREVTFMDSSGIGLVMGRYRLMQEIGGRVRVTNLASHLRKVMQLSGLDKLVDIDNGRK